MNQEASRLLVTASLAGGERRYRLGPGEHVLGSASDADVQLDDPTISRHHLRAIFDDTGARFEDLTSSNGTWLDGIRVDAAALEGQTLELRLGEIAVRFERLDPGEVRLAVPGDAPDATDGPTGPTRTTWAEGDLARFSLRELPALVEALASSLSPEGFAQRLAAALASTMTDTSLLVRRDGAVVASAGDDTAGPTPTPRARGPWTVELHAADDVVERNEPLIGLALRLLQATAGRGAAPAPGALPVEATPAAALPDPPTLSPALRTIYDQAARLAASEIGVLIHGETGTGKELLARFLHASSGLAEDRLV
ncbi:MAG: FHA domain-containing protein, partial [Pseudomonadota bacterium]